MKKLLSLLGVVTIGSSGATTVVGCQKKSQLNNPPDFTKLNNSLANLRGSAGVLGKQIAIADQFKLNFHSLQEVTNQTFKAQDTIPDYEANDFGLKTDSDLQKVTDQYFANATNFDQDPKVEFDKGIKLDNVSGQKGQNELWNLLEMKFGFNLNESAPLIESFLGIIANGSASQFLKIFTELLPEFDEPLGDLIKENQAKVSKILAEIKNFYQNEALIKNVESKLDRLSIGKLWPDLQQKNFINGVWITLANGIGYLVSPDYQATTFENEDGKNYQSMLKKNELAGENLAKTLLNQDQENPELPVDLATKIDRYGEILVNFLQAFQLLQLHLAAFDNTIENLPKADQTDQHDHLFDPKMTNKKAFKKILASGPSNTLATVLTNHGQSEGFINLKYLIGVLKKAFGEVNNKNQTGYGVQRLLYLLFASPLETNVDFDKFDANSASPFSRFLQGFTDQYLIRALKKMAGDSSIINMIPGFWKDISNYLFTIGIEKMLSGQTLKDVVDTVIDKVYELLARILQIGGIFLPKEIKILLETLLSDQGKKDFRDQVLKNKIAHAIPLFNELNAWKELWGGKPLVMDQIAKNQTEILKLTGDLFDPKDEAIKQQLLSQLKSGFKALEKINKQLNTDLLPDAKPFNFRNLLIIPMWQIGKEREWSGIGIHYLSQSLTGLINDLADDLAITGEEKLLNPEIAELNFEFSLFKRLWLLFKEYNYNDLPKPEIWKGKNLLEIILNNPDEISRILGVKKGTDGQENTIGKGSLLEFVLRDMLKINLENPDKNPNGTLEFVFQLINTLIFKLNHQGADQGYEKVFKELFEKQPMHYQYQNLTKDQHGGYLSEKVQVTYQSPISKKKVVYELNYSRKKITNKFQITKIDKKTV